MEVYLEHNWERHPCSPGTKSNSVIEVMTPKLSLAWSTVICHLYREEETLQGRRRRGEA